MEKYVAIAVTISVQANQNTYNAIVRLQAIGCHILQLWGIGVGIGQRQRRKKMGEFPTQKQEDYARKIAKTLGISLPSMRTKQAYWIFINENENAYKREQQRWRASSDDLEMYGIDECEYIGHIVGDI